MIIKNLVEILVFKKVAVDLEMMIKLLYFFKKLSFYFYSKLFAFQNICYIFARSQYYITIGNIKITKPTVTKFNNDNNDLPKEHYSPTYKLKSITTMNDHVPTIGNSKSNEPSNLILEKFADANFYLEAAIRTKENLKSIITGIPLEDQITALDLANAIKSNPIKTAFEPIRGNILLAVYYTDSTLTLNVEEKDNKNFSPELDCVVVAKAKDVEDVELGDIVIYEPSAGLRIQSKDIMDRKQIRLALTGIKNRDYETLISGANRVNLRMFVIVKQHEIICIRHDA